MEVVGDAQVTLWEYVETEGRVVDFWQLGELIGRLHRLPLAELQGLVSLPFCGDAEWLDVGGLIDRLERLRAVDGAQLEALRHASTRISGWREHARRGTPVICHGDVHPQNVLMSPEGVVLLDWDSICLGPPAFDHAALMTWSTRWGGGAATYGDFARGYGQDMRNTRIGEQLAALRLLAHHRQPTHQGGRGPGCGTRGRATHALLARRPRSAALEPGLNGAAKRTQRTLSRAIARDRSRTGIAKSGQLAAFA